MIVTGLGLSQHRGDPIKHINAFKQSELADVSGSVGDAVVIFVLGEVQEIGNECCVVRHGGIEGRERFIKCELHDVADRII